MKIPHLHITILISFLAFLSGFTLHSTFSGGNQIIGDGFTHLSAHNSNLNLTGESEKPAGMNGLASIKQGIQATEASSINISIDKTYYFKRASHLLFDNSLELLIKVIGYYSYPIKLFSKSIAINAP
jgi:hypothetical protein